MMIFERYAHLKYKSGHRHFWCRGYYVSTVGGNKQAVQKYIRNQEQEDLITDQISMVEYYDSFRQWLGSNLKKKGKPKKIRKQLACVQSQFKTVLKYLPV